MKDWTEVDRTCPCHVIMAGDTPGDRFKKFALLSIFPWRTEAAREVAIALYASMNWEKGTIRRRTSIRELATKADMSKQAVQDGLKILERLTFIRTQHLGVGRRGSIELGAIAEVPVGTVVFDYCSEISGLSYSAGRFVLTSRTVAQIEHCPTQQDASVLPIRTYCPTGQDAIPSPLIPHKHHQLASRQAELVRLDPASNLTSLPIPKLTQPENPKSDSSGGRTRVAPATRNSQVADAPNPYGYGTEIAGLNGSTSAIVDRIHQLDGGMVSKHEIWVEVLEVAKATSAEQVRIAIDDMERKKKRNDLRRSAKGALASFARSVRKDDIQRRIAEIEQEATKPRVSRLDMFGLRK